MSRICVGQQKVYSPDVPSFLSFSKELVWVNRASGGRVSDGWQGSEWGMSLAGECLGCYLWQPWLCSSSQGVNASMALYWQGKAISGQEMLPRDWKQHGTRGQGRAAWKIPGVCKRIYLRYLCSFGRGEMRENLSPFPERFGLGYGHLLLERELAL